LYWGPVGYCLFTLKRYNIIVILFRSNFCFCANNKKYGAAEQLISFWTFTVNFNLDAKTDDMLPTAHLSHVQPSEESAQIPKACPKKIFFQTPASRNFGYIKSRFIHSYQLA
jgi:hypothetical protein